MASGTQFKIFDDAGTMVAQARDPHLAAALIGAAGYEGWRVKFSGRIIWREGSEEIRAGESSDHAAEIMRDRIMAQYLAERDRRAAQARETIEAARLADRGIS